MKIFIFLILSFGSLISLITWIAIIASIFNIDLDEVIRRYIDDD